MIRIQPGEANSSWDMTLMQCEQIRVIRGVFLAATPFLASTKLLLVSYS